MEHVPSITLQEDLFAQDPSELTKRAVASTLSSIKRWGKSLICWVHCNILNYTNIAKDVGVDTKTVQSYFEILEDTLVGYLLPPYHRSLRKQQRQSPKFYFFDIGVKRTLDGSLVQTPVPNTYGFGKLFENFIILETLRLNDYFKKDFRLYYLLTKDHAEIDLIIERPGMPTALVEIKSSEHVDERDTRTVERFLKDFKKAEGFCLSRDPHPKKIGSVLALPWEEGLTELGLMP